MDATRTGSGSSGGDPARHIRRVREVRALFLFVTLFGSALGASPLLGLATGGALALLWVVFLAMSVGLVRTLHHYGDHRFVAAALALVIAELVCVWAGILFVLVRASPPAP